MIFNRALTEQEIQQIYLAGSAGKCRPGENPFCGNLIVEPQLGEQCDDGNLYEDDLCSNQCIFTYCGDSVIQEPNGVGLGGQNNDGNEQCDCGDDGICTPDELDGASCFQFGMSGALGCYSIDENPPLACTFNFGGCYSQCGDGICSGGENACNCDVDCPGTCGPVCPPGCFYDPISGLCVC